MIGDLPVPGIVVSACDAAICRVTEFHRGGTSIRLELAYLEAREISSPVHHGVDVFEGWWLAVAFDDGSVVRFGDPSLDDTDEDAGRHGETDDDVGLTSEPGLYLREAETSTDGRQIVGSRLFDVLGPGRVLSISSGWDRIGLRAGTAEVATGANLQERITTKAARPPGWLTHMAYHPDQESADEIDSYTMQWDWPSRLIRWVEVRTDGSLRAYVAATDSSGAQASRRLPTPVRLAAAPVPQRLPLPGGTFDQLWSLAETTGRVPEAHMPS